MQLQPHFVAHYLISCNKGIDGNSSTLPCLKGFAEAEIRQRSCKRKAFNSATLLCDDNAFRKVRCHCLKRGLNNNGAHLHRNTELANAGEIYGFGNSN
ncbi:hypothetical protein CDAR_556271 [Caerostris darwini]|uniref:Uncharacterized protein n=1 Tax=Caerostris darwini TaxID=1538125 RepID=A0AAV4MCD9_9ARAC|nr:hypothetical protein CDAR_556271 [Caerostris darwini]